jgi:hypothetical protein
MSPEILALPDVEEFDVVDGYVALESVTVVDSARVTPKPKVPVAANNPSWWAKHGNSAQWAAVVGTALLGLINIGLLVSYHNEAKNGAASDDHVNTLIANKLGDVTTRLDGIASKLDDLEGWRRGLEDRFTLQLQGIRTKLKSAEVRQVALSPSEIDDYKAIVRTFPSASAEYWQTVAAIINYQSLINEMKGKAPDPAKVAKECVEVGPTAHNNVMRGFHFRNCVAYLDTNTFQDSVVHYRGGPVVLENVGFTNCRFILDLAGPNPKPSDEKLLFALLESPDQKTIQISK